MSRKRNTRYPHAFSKGRGTWFHPLGDSRRRKLVKVDYPVKLDPARWKALKVSPTVATLYKGNQGLAVICASCLSGRGYRNPGLPEHFKRHWHLTLIELEKLCRCELCGQRDARVYPWTGHDGADLGLGGPPRR